MNTPASPGATRLHRPRRGVFSRCSWLAWMLLGFTSLTSQAHPNLQNALWVQFEPTQAHVALTVSLREIAVVAGWSTAELAQPDPDHLAAAATAQADYVLHHLTLTAGTQTLAGRVVRLTPPPALVEPENTFWQCELVYPWTGSPPAEVSFCQNMLQEWPYALGTPWEVSYTVRTKRLDTPIASVWLLRRQIATPTPTGWRPATTPDPTPIAVPPTSSHLFRDYFAQGVWHILTGYDHLLFVAALILATVRFWEMVRVIAAFTLAHTLTLSLCAFGICRLPAWVVEPVIALSIVLVALENVYRPARAHSRLRLAVAFGFGLIHGLGFAGGLLDAMAGLPTAPLWTALGAFSLGVETGHQLVVLPLFAMLALNRRAGPPVLAAAVPRYGSGMISVGGAYYLAVALHEQWFALR